MFALLLRVNKRVRAEMDTTLLSAQVISKVVGATMGVDVPDFVDIDGKKKTGSDGSPESNEDGDPESVRKLKSDGFNDATEEDIMGLAAAMGGG